MNAKKLANFIYFISDSFEGDLDQVKKELREVEIEPDDIPEIISETIRKNRAEYKIERGRLLKEKAAKLLKDWKNKSELKSISHYPALAFRNAEGLDQKDINEIAKDNKLMEELFGGDN